jgi:PAS domain S-box-containing protein
VLVVIIFSTAILDDMNMMGQEIKKTEKKYRNLVERSTDIIFSLDENLNLQSVNRAMKKHLGFAEDDVIGKNFLDFIQEKWSEKHMISRMMAEEYISDLKRTRKSVSFKTDFRTRYSHEPKEMVVTLEYGDTEDGSVNILGKAALIADDIIINYLESEKHIYSMDNYLNNADLMSQKLTGNLTKFLKGPEISGIRIALREMLINAIEHGNLNINFEEKSKAMLEGNYFGFIQERQKDKRFMDRKVCIDYLLTEERVEYRISDQGIGFDFNSMISQEENNPEKNPVPHGRGLLLSMSAFDEVKYNEKGNQVLLIKHFKKTT